VELLIIQTLNSLFYASILFLIACGLTLVYGVMRIVNMAHGNICAVGAYVAAWTVGLAVAAKFPPAALFFVLLSGAGERGPHAGVLASHSAANRCFCISANSALSMIMPKSSRREAMIETLSSYVHVVMVKTAPSGA
jgi:branched-subunit amino acid ABC-type transport system permease component